MRVEISVTPGSDNRGWSVSVSFAGRQTSHEMRRVDGPLPVGPESSRAPGVDQPHHLLDSDPQARAEICKRIADRHPREGDIELIGRYLFDTLIGSETWGSINAAARAEGESMVELALAWRADNSDLNIPKWELMHDGDEFLAAFKAHPVAITRIVEDSREPEQLLQPLNAPARVLFVIGADLDDPDIRAGAEIIGLLRRVEEGRGAIIPFILEHASLRTLRREVRRISPDVVHFVTHGRVQEGRGELSMQKDDGELGAAYISAQQLLDTLSDGADRLLPRLAVITACESASADNHTVPFAAELVKGGIPIVVGMTGVISDPVCRLFSNRFGAALTEGAPLVRALTDGRRAALWQPSRNGARPENHVDWALPAVFLARSVPQDHVLIELQDNDALHRRIDSFGLQQKPVFCGRRKFMRLLDRLLDPTDQLNVLVAAVERRTDGEVGETRLMHELARRALRSGHIVMMISAGANGTRSDPPTTPGLLALFLVQQLFETHRRFGLDAPRNSAILDALTRAATTNVPTIAGENEDIIHQRFTECCKELEKRREDWKDGLDADVLREALAHDLEHLQTAARAREDPSLAENCKVIVLLERIERWGSTTGALVDTLLTPTGFGVGENRIPVVLTCTVTDDPYFHTLRVLGERARAETWIHMEPLERFSEKEDTLAYQWMLLNPYAEIHPPSSEKVYVPTKPTDEWATVFRTNISGLPSRFGLHLYMVASTLSYAKILTEDDNDEVKLAAYARDSSWTR